MKRPFNCLYAHGFVRTAVCLPHVRVADPAFNAERVIGLAEKAAGDGAILALFPELCISAYSNEDLFQQDALLEAVREAIRRIVDRSRSITAALLVGAPLRFEGRLFNCAVVIHAGRVLGIVPKSYLPNYREFYEPRQFAAARAAGSSEVDFLGGSVPFGPDLIFEATNIPHFALFSEICEDVWVPVPPSTWATLAGASVVANLSAGNITVGRAEYRHRLCAAQSGRCVAAYLYSGAGPGESTTDVAWDGHALIYENSDLVGESDRFSPVEQIIMGDIDLDRLVQERSRLSTFTDSISDFADRARRMRRIRFELSLPAAPVRLQRKIERFPYVPSDAHNLNDRCYEAYNIQVHGLLKRLESTGIERIVIGISGGLDSTHALIIAAKTMDRLGLPRHNVLAYTMPGFATGEHTRSNAHRLMEAMGVSASEIDIRPSAMQMLHDIGHPFAENDPVHDVTFENVQAGERTSHLFRLANHHGGMVLGTGDLSELALGWTTYGVGDHMSHYNVNGSVPKTLIQYLIRWVINRGEFDSEVNRVLQAVLETEISPELVPGAEGEVELQSTESQIGPYELQDFNLYYTTRFGYRPSKIAYLAHHAWHSRDAGTWPALFPVDKRNEYDLKTIKKWLEVFVYRFFQISQYKRSVMPNGPKVGSGGSLSPRGDWRAPSDAEAAVWLDELRRNVPEDQ